MIRIWIHTDIEITGFLNAGRLSGARKIAAPSASPVAEGLTIEL
jgi:hypothetical protein